MTTAYSPLLGLALPVTGELAGTWGDTVNNYITSYLDSAVAGTQTISGSQTAVTLTTTTNATLSQAGTGSTGSAQYNIINCTGNPAATLVIDVPKASKTYLVINATSTNRSVTVRGGPSTPTTGVTLIAGERALVAWNGSDFIKVASSEVDGVSTISFGTTGLTPSTATSGAVTVAGTLATTNGGTGLTSFTANRVFYASSTSAIGQSANLTFDGTTLVASNLTDSSLTSGRVTYAGAGGNLTDSANLTFDGTNLTLGGGTANGVAYLNGSKVLTTGGNLTFDGTTLTGTSATSAANLVLNNTSGATQTYVNFTSGATVLSAIYRPSATNDFRFDANFGSIIWGIGSAGTATEQMRLTSTGLGIGTSSPAYKLDVNGVTRLGAGTPAILAGVGGAFAGGQGELYTIGTNTMGIGTTGAAALRLYTNSTLQATIDPSGNLGLGVTPSAWVEGTGLNVGSGRGGSIFTETVNYGFTTFNANAYYSATNTWKYVTSNAASRYQQLNGVHSWYTAGSGTAGNAISFTQALTLTAAANLLLGGTSDPGGEKALYIANTSSVPGTPTGGGVLYVEGGALKYKGSSGTVTTIANA